LLTETDGTDAADPVPEAPAEPVAPAAKVAPAKKGTDLWAELKAIFWLILAVLTFHSLIAKPFYIPSESMMPVLLKGDRLVVSKFPYGWSWVSPSFHIFPRTEGRLWGSLPERGDIVIVTPPGRKLGLYQARNRASRRHDRDDRRPAHPQWPGGAPRGTAVGDAPGRCQPALRARRIRDSRVRGNDGQTYCRLRIFREYLPNGRYYDTIDAGRSQGDDYPRTPGAAGSCLPDGRQSRP
jgi:signal peptidase I